MNRSCLEGPLTTHCARCRYWNANGGIGCGCPFPIAWCGAFSAMEKLYSANSGDTIAVASKNGNPRHGTIIKKNMPTDEALVRLDDGTLMWVDAINILWEDKNENA